MSKITIIIQRFFDNQKAARCQLQKKADALNSKIDHLLQSVYPHMKDISTYEKQCYFAIKINEIYDYVLFLIVSFKNRQDVSIKFISKRGAGRNEEISNLKDMVNASIDTKKTVHECNKEQKPVFELLKDVTLETITQSIEEHFL